MNISNNSNGTKTEDILLSLHAMMPQLTQQQIKHIYFHECKQDFKQSVDYLLQIKIKNINNNNNNDINK
jgi:hypothetical protein